MINATIARTFIWAAPGRSSSALTCRTSSTGSTTKPEPGPDEHGVRSGPGGEQYRHAVLHLQYHAPLLAPARVRGSRSDAHGPIPRAVCARPRAQCFREVRATGGSKGVVFFDRNSRYERKTDTRHAADPEPRPGISHPRGGCGLRRTGGAQGAHRSDRDRSQQRVPARQHAASAALPGESRGQPGLHSRAHGLAAARRQGRSILGTFFHQHLRDLAAKLGETSHFAVREGGQVLFVDHHAPTGQVISVAGQTGEFAPLHCTAHGKALLADFDRSAEGPVGGCAAARLLAHDGLLADDAWPSVQAGARRRVRPRRRGIHRGAALRRGADPRPAGRDRRLGRDLLARNAAAPEANRKGRDEVMAAAQ